MELPDIGLRCSKDDCKQLDFLPLVCKCGKQFCSIHFNEHVEDCESVQQYQTEPRKIEALYKCSHSECNETSLIPLMCGKCQQHFCIRHRHLTQCQDKDEKQIAEEKERITAPLRQFNAVKKELDKQIEHNLNAAKKKEKHKNLVNKVQLMKLKNKATGLRSIPSADRVYFNVINPGNKEGVPIFIAKNWTVGRAIDAIADECKLQNWNNKSSEKKLRLFKKENGEILTKNLAVDIQTLISESVIVDGDNLVMEYVDSNCQSVLENK